MSTQHSPSPRDDEIDALLARRYRDTTPEFEGRWVELKRQLRQAPPRRRLWTWPVWSNGAALAGAAAAVVFALALWKSEAPPVADSMAVSPALAELFAMDAVLGRATALLDAENREALLHLPVDPQPRI